MVTVTAIITFYLRRLVDTPIVMEKEILKNKCESLQGPEDYLKTVTLPIFLDFLKRECGGSFCSFKTAEVLLAKGK